MLSKTSKLEKWLLWAALLFLPLTLILPLWDILIYAPQYPEGLSMTIWLDKITGDLNNVNIINHYIGMKAIDANAIPELVYFPKVAIALTAFGFLCAATGRRFFRSLWAVVLLILAVAAFYDFYAWEYDYGHNLSPDAPIKMEGMTYSPPLFGYEKMLNIEVYSYPGWGGIAFTLTIVLVWISLLLSVFSKKAWLQAGLKKVGLLKFLSLALFVSLTSIGCTPVGPARVELGVDLCDQCQMTITDGRFATEWISPKGKIHRYDSLDCLQNHLAGEGVDLEKARVFVSDFLRPGVLIPANEAQFLVAKKVRGPMGTHWVTTLTNASAKELQQKFQGELKTWKQVLSSEALTPEKGDARMFQTQAQVSRRIASH